MLLKSIELKNFRQFVDEKMDFSVDDHKNVTIIIGENGTGKTTFAQAFFWCFYGETSFSDKNVINRKVFADMLPDVPKEVRVTVCLKHGDIEYTVIRTQNYKKTYSNKMECDLARLDIAKKDTTGNTTHVEHTRVENEINQILPKDLSPYFFFDGERIEKMSKEITGGKKSASFAEAVSDLTGLKAMGSAIKHLGQGKNSVLGKLNDEYISDSDGKIKQLSEQIDMLQTKIENADARIAEIDESISAAEAMKEQCGKDIKQFSDGAALQRQREQAAEQIAGKKTLKKQMVKDAVDAFDSQLTSFFSISLAKKALEMLADTELSGKDIPNMHSDTINYLLSKGVCICGTQLNEGSIAHQKVCEYLQYLPPHSIGVSVSNFISGIRGRFSANVTLHTAISNKLTTIETLDEDVENLEQDIVDISTKLDGKDFNKEVRELNSRISECNKIISKLRNERDQLIAQRGADEKERRFADDKRQSLSLHDKNNRQVELFKRYTTAIHNALSEELSLKETETRERLQDSINEIFQNIYNGGLSLTIDEKYNISVQVNDYDGVVETSTAQSIAVIFAFISAISKMAKENKTNENANQSYSEPYPLVMDAPLSAFDKRRIESICKALPETAEQVIIFIKDTDGELAERFLGDRILKKHEFQKVDELHTHLI